MTIKHIDDLLDPALPESVVDDDLRRLGVDPLALAQRGREFVAVVKEEVAAEALPPSSDGHGAYGFGSTGFDEQAQTPSVWAMELGELTCASPYPDAPRLWYVRTLNRIARQRWRAYLKRKRSKR